MYILLALIPGLNEDNHCLLLMGKDKKFTSLQSCSSASVMLSSKIFFIPFNCRKLFLFLSAYIPTTIKRPKRQNLLEPQVKAQLGRFGEVCYVLYVLGRLSIFLISSFPQRSKVAFSSKGYFCRSTSTERKSSTVFR